MTTQESLPVVFLAFASEISSPNSPLPRLPEEARALRRVLDRSGRCELVIRQDATLDDVLDVFQDIRYRGRIEVFHFAGHAGEDHLLLEENAGTPLMVYAGGLIAALANEPNVNLVFLNGCSTEAQADRLLKSGVGAVVATSADIDDSLAHRFAVRFYEGLASGATIAEAYSAAQAEVTAVSGSHLDRVAWQWVLSPPDSPALLWTLPAAGRPLLAGNNSGLPVWEESPDALDPDHEARSFTPSIRDHMAALHREIKQLTEEQFRVIQQLRLVKRVRISGCAGSGKTLVAAEKACRLAKNGARVLFLCHNPLLAEHVHNLVVGQGIDVVDFCRWIADVSEAQPSAFSSLWTHYEEPDEHVLAQALDQLTVAGGLYDAIIVDEAQDFRGEWWVLVEAALIPKPDSHFYIFHDNHQMLLSHRGDYPIPEPEIDLSRNCRNSGRIFELMRCYDNRTPEAELGLKQLGKLELIRYEAGKENFHVSKAVAALARDDLLGNAVVLVGSQGNLPQMPFANLEVPVAEVGGWQAEIAHRFQGVIHRYDPRGVEYPKDADSIISAEVAKLSDSPFPTDSDVARVVSLAKAFPVDGDTRRTIQKHLRLRGAWQWTILDGRLRYRRQKAGPIWAAEVLLRFQDERWPRGIPKPRVISVLPYDLPQTTNTLPMYKIEDFKGLEADAVILVLQGRAPNHKESVYVGISRARLSLTILVDDPASASLPRTFVWG